MIKLAIGLPFGAKDSEGHPRLVHPEWACALANMQFPMNCTYARISIKGVPRAEARTRLVETAMALEAEYLLFLDDDTAPPYDTAVKLIATMDNDPTIAAAGGIYTSRDGAVNEPMVFMAEGAGPHWRWRFGDVFRCWALGTGCLMVRLAVFETLPKPWFWDVQSKDDAKVEPELLAVRGGYEPIGFSMTDDIYFCRKVNAAGYSVMAHGGLLPVHYGASGPHVLDAESYPVRGVTATDLWYWSLLPQAAATVETRMHG